MVNKSTVLIGRIISIYLITTSLGFLISADYYSKMVATKNSDPILVNLSGMTHFLIGMSVMVFHFKWKKFVEILVSLLGVFYLLKGAFLIVLPEFTLTTSNNEVQANLWGSAVGFLIYGAITAYLTWFRYAKALRS